MGAFFFFGDGYLSLFCLLSFTADSIFKISYPFIAHITLENNEVLFFTVLRLVSQFEIICINAYLIFNFFLFFRRKSKAPLPPSETKSIAVSPFDNTEPTNLIMEQKENVIDKDIELSVVLPGDVIKYTTVNGRYATQNDIFV